jgi:glycosyltransferase involved in cell wall biosynthesis
MQLLYSTETDLSIDNGPGINEREFVDSLLNDYGDKVKCIIPYPKYPEKYFNPGIEYVFPYFSNPFRYPLYLWALFIRILSLVCTHRFDAFVFRLGIVPIVPLISAHLLKKPVFLKTLAGYYAFEKENRNWKRRVLAIATHPFYRAIVQKALAADTVSIPYIEWLHDKFGIDRKKVHVIPNGVNVDFFSFQDKSKCRKELGLNHFSKIVGYVGALDSLRHIDDLILAMQRINKQEHVGLVLVGSGEGEEKYKKMVHSLGLNSNVIFTGKVSYQEVPKYMNAFDIGIDLSLIPMQVGDVISNASYSQKIPQYLSCGLAVVAWNTKDTLFLKQEYIGDVAQVGNIDDLARVISEQLSRYTIDGDNMHMYARAYAVSRFSTQVLSAQRVELWETSLKNMNRKA